MYQKNTVKVLAVILLSALAVSIFGSSSAVAAKNDKKVTNVYRSSYLNFVKQQQKKTKKKICYAIVKASKNKMPVLLVTTENDWMKSSDEKGAIQANVYSYHKGKVVYITKMQSTGSGYPLLKQGKYIISGWHHSSQRLMVSGAEGHLESVDGFGMDDGKCHKRTWTVAEGRKKTGVISKKISEKRAGLLDYYSNAYENGGKIIKFKEVK